MILHMRESGGSKLNSILSVVSFLCDSMIILAGLVLFYVFLLFGLFFFLILYVFLIFVGFVMQYGYVRREQPGAACKLDKNILVLGTENAPPRRVKMCPPRLATGCAGQAAPNVP